MTSTSAFKISRSTNQRRQHSDKCSTTLVKINLFEHIQYEITIWINDSFVIVKRYRYGRSVFIDLVKMMEWVMTRHVILQNMFLFSKLHDIAYETVTCLLLTCYINHLHKTTSEQSIRFNPILEPTLQIHAICITCLNPVLYHCHICSWRQCQVRLSNGCIDDPSGMGAHPMGIRLSNRRSTDPHARQHQMAAWLLYQGTHIRRRTVCPGTVVTASYSTSPSKPDCSLQYSLQYCKFRLF